ncbi:MAG: phytanoyl-CoA dioxygenase family protein [Candidatus Poribacteria bacterium]
MSNALTPDQLDFFGKNGYLIIEAAFDADEIARMRADADSILELILNSSVANERRSGQLDMRARPDGVVVVRKIQPINDLSACFTAVSADERLVGPLGAVMGDDPVLMEEKLNYKQPLLGPVDGIDAPVKDDSFPIHNDWAYYRSQNYPQGILSSAVTVDECAADSGPLRVWPGSHLTHIEHESMDNGLQVLPGTLDFDGGVDILAPAGSVMLFHALLVHNSRPNVSGRPRRLMIFSHYPAAADMGADVRNGPTRLRESPYEWEYERRRARGDYVDTFAAPTYA